MNNKTAERPLTMKKAYTRVGLSMLVFYGVLSVVSTVTLVAALLILFFGRGSVSGNWLRDLLRDGISNVMNDPAVTDAILYGSVAGSLLGFPVGMLVMKTVLPKFRRAPERHDLDFLQVMMILVMSYGLWGVGAILGNLPSFFGIEMISDYTEGASTAALLVYTLYAVLGAPVLEELVFRKMLLDRTHGYGQVVAAFVTALMFGLIHGNPAQFPLAFMLGLLLATVYMKTGNIFYTMLMHFLINFTASIPELVYLISGADVSMGWNMVIPVLIVTGIVFIIVFRKNDLLKLKRSYNPKANPDTFKNVGMILAIIGGGLLVLSSVGLSLLENIRYNGLAALWTLVPIAVSAATIILVPITVGRHYIVRVVHPGPASGSGDSAPKAPQPYLPQGPQYGPQHPAYGPESAPQNPGYGLESAPQAPLYGTAPQPFVPQVSELHVPQSSLPQGPGLPAPQPPLPQEPGQPAPQSPLPRGPQTQPPKPLRPAESMEEVPLVGAAPPLPGFLKEPAVPEGPEAPAMEALEKQIEMDYLRAKEAPSDDL